MKKKDYLLAIACGIGLLLIFWIFSDLVEGSNSSVPFVMMAVYLAAVAALSRKMTSWDCLLFSLISQLTVFVGYKALSIAGAVRDYRADGFLADYEVGPYQMSEMLLFVFLISCFVMTALIRFALARKKFRQIPKKTLKRLGIYLLLLAALGILNHFSWNFTKPLTAKFDTYCESFTPAKWEQYVPKRELMLPDFMVQHKGISQDELEQLLGEPEQKEGYFVGYSSQGQVYVSFVFDDTGALSDITYVSKSPFGDRK